MRGRGYYDSLVRWQDGALLKYIDGISLRNLKLGVDNLNRLSLQKRDDFTSEHQRFLYAKLFLLPFSNGTTELYSLTEGLSIVVLILIA
jgi:hypothetical protein